MRHKRSWWLLPLLVLLATGSLVLNTRRATKGTATPVANRVLARALEINTGRAPRPRYMQPLSAGLLTAALEGSGELSRRLAAAGSVGHPPVPSFVRPGPTPGAQGCEQTFGNGKNIRVNQDCSLRRQAEEVIAVDPNNPLHLIAGQNDSRIGFNHCAYDWSFDGGHTWGDLIPPFWQFALADGHTADACADPTAAFDHLGNAYVGGVLFDINSPASGIVVAKSNADIGGRFYHSPANMPFQVFQDLPLGVVANDSDPDIIHDKELLTTDTSLGSPKRGNVYVTWTRFNANTGAGVGADSPIFFSQSTDGGATWSAGVEVSGGSPTLCTAESGEADANACDQDQGSRPLAGSDGTVYVTFNNGNTPTLGLNQYIIVSCGPLADCSQTANWTAPVKIADDIGTQPLGPAAGTGCSAGDQCLPPNGYRLSDAVAGSPSVDQNGVLYFSWADFRNGGGSCDWNAAAIGQAATATPPCNNDVFYVFSTDGGATWSSARNITPASSFGQTAQWQPWSAVGPKGAQLWVAYYDRSYGSCEVSGCNDITLARIRMPTSATPSISYTRVTTASMPNLVPANNPVEAGFLGDYMWVTVDRDGRPYVVWADTRGMNAAVEEDVYFRPPS